MSRRLFPFPVLCVLLFIGATGPVPAGAQNGSAESIPVPSDSTRLLIPLPFFSKVGFQTGFVNTDELDTGVDFGALISKDLYRDFLDVTTTFHLWGATNDTLDVATAGVDAAFTYKIPIRWGWYGYAGFILGYGYVHSEKVVLLDGRSQRSRTSGHEFQSFITGGAEFDLHSNRTLFLQVKLGTTNLSREIHVICGMNFYTKYKKFMPWLAPPLMRD